MQRTPIRPARLRPGFSFLELQVSFLLLGIAMAGLGPLVVMQAKHLAQLESRFDDDQTYYLVPFASDWACKLGAAAAVQTTDPGPPPPPSPPPATLIDNGTAGYSEVDVGSLDWRTRNSSEAYHSTYREQNGGGVGDNAFWTFEGLRPGWYRVLVTYPSRGSQATNAPYTVFDDGTALGTVRVNQRLAPTGPLFDGSRWTILGTFPINSGRLRVRLSDNANGDIAADAVRMIPIRNNVQILTVTKSLSSEEVTANVSVTYQTP